MTTESDFINSLQLASLDVDVDDAIITICMKLDYYSIRVYGPHEDHVI